MTIKMEHVQRQYAKATRSSDVKSEGVVIMGPNQNWEQYLVPAPYTVQILARVLQVSTERDFSLENNPPQGGFKRIRQPTSFRACLVQVAGEGYRAFQEAHSSMDNIQLRCQKMPVDFTEALKILFHGGLDEVESMLHIPLNSINEHAAVCRQLAENVADKFDDVQDLLQELLEVSAANQGHYEDELMNAKIRQRRNQIKKERYEKQEKEQKRMQEELAEARRDAEERFKKAQDSIPDGWEVMGMNFVDGLLKTVNNVASAAPMALLGYASGGGLAAVAGAVAVSTMGDAEAEAEAEAEEGGEAEGETQKQAPDPKEPGMLDLIKTASKIMAIPEGLKEMFTYEKDEETGKKERKFDVKDGSEQALGHFLDEMKEIKQAAEEANPSSKKNLGLKRKATEVSTAAIEYIEGLQSAIENMGADLDVMESYEGLLKIWSSSSVVENMIQNMTNEPTLGTSGPNAKIARPKITSRSQGNNVGQIAVENAKLKVENSKQYLSQTRELFKQAQKNYNETHNKMTEILAELEQATAEAIDFEQIKMVLTKGIRAMGRLREQWAKLCLFFIMVKNYISITLEDTVKNFLKYAREGETKRIGGMTITKLHQDLIFNNAFRAIKIAYVVENIAGAYVDISSKHLLHRIAGLPKIIGYDADKEKDKIMALVNEISAGCDDAQRQIDNEMKSHRRQFENEASSRLAKIKKTLDDTLPDPQPEVLKAIEDAGKESKKELAWDENLSDGDNDDDDGLSLDDLGL